MPKSDAINPAFTLGWRNDDFLTGLETTGDYRAAVAPEIRPGSVDALYRHAERLVRIRRARLRTFKDSKDRWS